METTIICNYTTTKLKLKIRLITPSFLEDMEKLEGLYYAGRYKYFRKQFGNLLKC